MNIHEALLYFESNFDINENQEDNMLLANVCIQLSSDHFCNSDRDSG